MTDFNINDYLNVNKENEHLGMDKLYNALAKQEKVHYIRRFCFVNFKENTSTPSKTVDDILTEIRQARLVDMICESCLHPEVVVEIDDKQVKKLNRIMDFFITTIEESMVMQDYILDQIDEYSLVDFKVFEFEIGFSNGRPTVNMCIAKPSFVGGSIEHGDENSVVLNEMAGFQVIDYAEFELFSS